MIPWLLALVLAGCEDISDDTGDGADDGPVECPLDAPLDGSELPCTCGGELVEALPGDGSTCVCDSTADFTCV